MPKLGQPVEPRHVDTVTPADRVAAAPAGEPTATSLPKNMPWPID